jgi:hypothetical protein
MRTIRVGSLAIVAALALSVEHGLALQSSRDTTFRLLTFQAGASGPRLGTTRGMGDQDVVDVHNAIREGCSKVRIEASSRA